MKYIAEWHLKTLIPATGVIKKPEIESAFNRQVGKVLLYGITSTLLYTMLYEFSGAIKHIAQLTYQGDKHLFYVPILIALGFSLVHGAFTSHFWDVLGLKPNTLAKS
ncbi:MAG: hypothetical protein OEY67_01490 [Gammaproteobacteria bacterium]|nr:hypothetical protein [Gammaproteobacteria bacterium]